MDSEMTDTQEEENRTEFLSEAAVFRRNAFILIETMVGLSNKTEQDTSMLVDEVLHSLFFLGAINTPPLSPQSLVDDIETLDCLKKQSNIKIYDLLKKQYPQPFQLYSTQLPRRCPFSCLLDMVVCCHGQANEDLIKKELKNIATKLKNGTSFKSLFSFTICISRINTPNSCRYYGVSTCTRGRPAGEILAASSCFSYWNRFVSDAVMTYYPDKQEKLYFSRRIKLPPDVKCEAFDISEGTQMDPCRSCSNLFGFDTNEKRQWGYGNCAEVQSLSKLFQEEQEVIMRVERNVPREDEDRLKAERRVLHHLKNHLKNCDEFHWDGKFYPNLNPIPQLV